MGAVAEQVKQIGTRIETGLKVNGWDQRPTPDRRGFASYRESDQLLSVPGLGVRISDLDLQDGQFGQRANWTSTDEEGTIRQRSVVIDTSVGTLSVIENTRLGEKIHTEILIVSDKPPAEGRPVYPSVPIDTPRHHATEEETQTILAELNAIVAPLRQRRNAAPVR